MKAFKTFLVIIGLSGCQSVVLVRPDNPGIMIIPGSPGPDYIYMNDSWRWNNRQHAYVTSKGKWVKHKRSLMWVDGYWKETRGGWIYKKGHWA